MSCAGWKGSSREGLRMETLGLSFVCPAELGTIGSQCAKMLVWGISQILHSCSFALLPETQAGRQL